MSTVLELHGLSKQYGQLKVTQNVDLTLTRGTRHALIGPNGAGKSTLVHQITGLVAPDAGRIVLNGVDITKMAPERRVKHGLARTFQINSLFDRLTVAENIGLAIGARAGIDGRLFSSITQDSALIDEVAQLLESLGLMALADRQITELAYGQRRLIEIALALALKPSVLLLDEPLAGVPSTEAYRLFDVLDNLPDDVATLLIEHDMEVVFRFADRITVLVEGAVFVEGNASEVRSDPRVRAVYLGERGND